MMFKTHLFSTVATGLPLWYVVGGDIRYYLAGLAIGAALPDIDERHSWIGVRARLVSNLLSLIVKHRGITHTIPMAIIVFIASFALSYGTIYNNISFGLAIGMILHSMGDMSTKEGGIALFYPFSAKRLYLLPSAIRYKTAGLIESILVFPFFVVLLFAELYLMGIFNFSLQTL